MLSLNHLATILYTVSLFCSIHLNTAAQSPCWRSVSPSNNLVSAISYDSTLWTWGGVQSVTRKHSFPVQLSSKSEWVKVSTDVEGILALNKNGTLWGYGKGYFGNGRISSAYALLQVSSDTNWSGISCGNNFTVAYKKNGTLWGWGINNNGQLAAGYDRTTKLNPIQIGTVTNVVEISAGRKYSLVRLKDSSLWAFGGCALANCFSKLNKVGQNDWKTMASGSKHSYAIKQNGELWTFSVVNGAVVGLKRIGNSRDWKHVATSRDNDFDQHTLLIKNDSSLWGIGKNEFGQLGTGNLLNTLTPVLIDSTTKWKDIEVGKKVSFGLKADSSYWVWGKTSDSQYGNGDNKKKLKKIESISGWKMISGSKPLYLAKSGNHAVGIKRDGSLWAWGSNEYQQLGLARTKRFSVRPIQVGVDSNWSYVSTGARSTFAIKNNGTLWGWGYASQGTLGIGRVPSSANTTPIQIGVDTTWKMVTANSDFAIGLKKDSSLWSWGGDNFYGQLGNDSTNPEYYPVQIAKTQKWIKVVAGAYFVAALSSDSTIWTWGNNSFGQLGRSGGLKNPTPKRISNSKFKDIDCGTKNLMALNFKGELFVCGANNKGQLGDSTTINKSSLQKVKSNISWIAFSAGYDYCLGIKSDSSLWVWGLNSSGQLADSASFNSFPNIIYTPTQKEKTDKWRSVEAGTYTSFFVSNKSDLFSCGEEFEKTNNISVLGYVNSTPRLVNDCRCKTPIYQYSKTICKGDSFVFNGLKIISPGVYLDTLINANGCDSLIKLNLVIENNKLTIDSITACDSIKWINGKTYTTSNFIDKDTLASINGCDSIIALNLIINKTIYNSDSVVACNRFTWLNGRKYISNNFTDTLVRTSNSGCDSVVRLHLVINKSTNSLDRLQTCDSLTWINGKTYYQSNYTDVDTLIGKNGCDSIVRLNLTINRSETSVDSIVKCDSLKWINGRIYTASNTSDTILLKSKLGCDSLVKLNLKILKGSKFIDTHIVCDQFKWIDGQVYTTNNTSAIHTLTNSQGCDSLVYLNLTVNKRKSSIDNQISCGTFKWIDGNEYSENNNSATHLLKTSKGCDSTITLNLRITRIDTSINQNGNELTSNQNGAQYQWLNCERQYLPISSARKQSFFANSNGWYAVEVKFDDCIDTSNCVELNSIGIEDDFGKLSQTIYPNPTNGMVTIDFGGIQKETEVYLFDATGKIIYKTSLFGLKVHTFKFEGEQGAYFLLVRSDDTLSRYQLIKLE